MVFPDGNDTESYPPDFAAFKALCNFEVSLEPFAKIPWSASTYVFEGTSETEIVAEDDESDPFVFETVNITIYVPRLEYVYDGFCKVLVPPSPNAHDHEVGEPVDVSVNRTVSGGDPEPGDATKSATSGEVTGLTVM